MEPTLNSFGGSALDRHVFDYETVADGGTDGVQAGEVPSQTAPAADPTAAGAEGGETDTSAVATEAAPAWTPEQIAALRNDPEFQSFLSEEASTIADARFQQRLEEAKAASAAAAAGGGDTGGEVDLNQFLDPYGDNFGTNLARVLGGIVQQFEQSLDQRFQPINEQAAQAQSAEQEAGLMTRISDAAAALGGLKGGDAALQRVRTDAETRYFPDALRTYGNTVRAADVAIDRAIRAERDYQNAIAGTTAVENVEHLATLDAARGDLAATGSGSGLVTLPNEPRSTRERVAAFAPQMQAERRSTQQ